MPGPQTPIIKPNKQYGDQQALDALARQGSGLKFDKAGPVTERRGVGRPPGAATARPPAAQPVAPATPIPEEHIRLMEEFARSALVASVWRQAAQDPMAGPWVRQYAKMAEEDYVRKGSRLRDETPFFE